MPTLPSWSDLLAQITAFTSLPLISGLLIFLIAIVAGAIFVSLIIWAVSKK